MHKCVKYWKHIAITTIIYSDQLPGTSKAHGQLWHTIPCKRSGYSRPPIISLASSDRDSYIIRRYDWIDQANCHLPPSDPIGTSKLILLFLSISSRNSGELLLLLRNLIVKFDTILQYYSINPRTSPISSNMIGPFQVDLHHLLKLNWEHLSILSNLISPIYWRSFTSLKCIHWFIVEELSPIWEILCSILSQLPYLPESNWDLLHFREISLVQFVK